MKLKWTMDSEGNVEAKTPYGKYTIHRNSKKQWVIHWAGQTASNPIFRAQRKTAIRFCEKRHAEIERILLAEYLEEIAVLKKTLDARIENNSQEESSDV